MNDDTKIEKQVHNKIVEDLFESKKQCEENLKNHIKELDKIIVKTKEQNIRLQSELDREIHINRIMKKALEKYVLPENYEGGMGRDYENMCNECKQTLKEIEEME